MKCTYHGFINQPMGIKLDCPICQAKLVVMSRDGQAWLPRHEVQKPVITVFYRHCYKGS